MSKWFSSLCPLALLLPAQAAQYPVGVTNCGVSSWINATPSRAVTMNQGATEMMLALNLSSHMVGTAYLDDEIWPEVADQYNSVQVLSDEYPTIDELLAVEPDFVYASYASAFQLDYVNYTAHVGECVLKISDVDDESSTNTTFCRKELNERGIQTYLQVAQCEQVEHRPEDSTVAVLFEEIWEIATVFDAFDEARQLVDNIDRYFDSAIEVSSRSGGDPVTVLWLDSWHDETPFVGACCGSVQTIIHHSGAKNVFDDVGLEAKSTWASVTWDDVATMDPDVVVVIDASWGKADQKIFNLCSNERTKKLRAVQNRAFISIPFSGGTLGVRMGAVAYNLAEAVAALTRNESLSSVSFSKVSITSTEDASRSEEAVSKSGVKVYTRLPVFNGTALESFCPGTTTQVQIRDVPRDSGSSSSSSTAPSPQASGLPSWSVALISVLGSLAALAVGFVAVMITREKKGKPLFEPLSSSGKEQSVWA